MLKNQKWVYSAPRPPKEFWDSLEDDDDAIAVASFLGKIEYVPRK